ncbi:DUF305 domain-containing protein [Mycolicibacterium peregrinum]|uniref:DUF305 domain-containing protein n=1 Tax=Mycolicibacterium peregrinum TaxID=43304 RepID=A0A4Z0HIP6_MYCPR|nr:DUF305 domain-containing protein [Mycolicibacterium peregrinum]TGB36313.1 DUF305 domain-containing protein [Mycolicibacterium peregrinum]TGB36508.1 DUF305 domain-containing protein [Mycolicibacterium peregrinum]
MSASIPARIFGATVVIAAAAFLGAFAESHRHDSPPPLMSEADVTFAQMMMTHHQQAITICDLLSADAAPEIRTLADQIRLQQQAEVGTMIGWLQLADQPLNPTAPTQDTGHGMAHHHDTGQPTGMQMGMATPDELARLQRATGRAGEALFLQLMTRHHQGGAEMAFDETRSGSNETIRRTALAMVTEQTQEIQVMEHLMKSRAATPLPYP